MTEPVQLSLASDSILDPKPHGGQVTLNPSIELLARAAGPNSLQISRPNGQVVTKSSQRGERETIQALRWKKNGTSPTARQ
jgi:anaphase-promoting complex subunit 4